MHKLISAIAATVIVTVMTGSISETVAYAHPDGIDYIQFNLWGRNGHDGDTYPVDVLVNHVDRQADSGHAPSAISLQEMCYIPEGGSQYHQLIDGLPEYTAAFTTTVSGLPDEACPNYGISLAMVGARSGVYEPSWEAYGLSPVGDELRAILCGHAALFGTWHNACSTHLENEEPVAQDQVNDVIWNASVFQNEHQPSSTMFVGGDFNLTPAEFDTDDPYDFWTEADQCCSDPTHSLHSTLNEKLDYIFIFPGYSDNQWAGFLSAPLASDHMLVEGYFDRSS